MAKPPLIVHPPSCVYGSHFLIAFSRVEKDTEKLPMVTSSVFGPIFPQKIRLHFKPKLEIINVRKTLNGTSKENCGYQFLKHMEYS